MPDSVSVPLPSTVSPPPPGSEMTPEKVPAPSVSVRVLAPRVTPPAPDSVVMEAPGAVAREISKVPASATPALAAIEPVPESASVSPDPMLVAPV